ncbi:MAG: cyclodeaminase/cyclohydrolase family protein [Candidatus Pacebacteria bacterium]|nr:cyclodeaminase/cyclohydrolase family protein [Candidatus Paceibacterota bacterium]
MLVDLTVAEFSRVLASDAPAPGGGSVAALSGALAADLLSMVCRLSLGKKEYEEHAAQLDDILKKSSAISTSLLHRIDLDTAAFNEVMAAFKLPKSSELEKKERANAIQQAYKKAVESPLGIARECRAVLQLASAALGKTNTNALSDLGVAGQEAIVGVEAAIMNVRINIPSLKDEAYRNEITSELSDLLQDARKLQQDVYHYVTERL